MFHFLPSALEPFLKIGTSFAQIVSISGHEHRLFQFGQPMNTQQILRQQGRLEQVIA
jgi:hypothetical protein